MNIPKATTVPTYYVCQWDGTHTIADPQPVLVPEDIFDRDIILIEEDCGAEPCIREMIEYYYRQAFTPEQAAYHADLLIAKALGKEPS